MSFNLGDVVPLSVTVKDANGNPANAGSVTLTVTLPDGTTDITADIASTTAGVYDHDFATAQAGVHQVRWVATGANASAFEDAFSVASATGLNFISLAEAKKHLKKDLTKTADDAELLEFVSAACSKIVDLVGPVAPTSLTQTAWPGWRSVGHVIVLDAHPVIEVTSVTIDGTAEPEADPDTGIDGWLLDAAAGLLGHTRIWPRGRVNIGYRVGRTPLPGNYRLAGLELTGHLWRTIKLNGTGGRPPVAGGDDIVIAGQAYALPNRVKELLGIAKNQTADVLVS